MTGYVVVVCGLCSHPQQPDICDLVLDYAADRRREHESDYRFRNYWIQLSQLNVFSAAQVGDVPRIAAVGSLTDADVIRFAEDRLVPSLLDSM
jgi:hypothetical protein